MRQVWRIDGVVLSVMPRWGDCCKFQDQPPPEGANLSANLDDDDLFASCGSESCELKVTPEAIPLDDEELSADRDGDTGASLP